MGKTALDLLSADRPGGLQRSASSASGLIALSAFALGACAAQRIPAPASVTRRPAVECRGECIPDAEICRQGKCVANTEPIEGPITILPGGRADGRMQRGSTRVTRPGIDGVIFAAAAETEWTPQLGDVLELEARLPAALRKLGYERGQRIAGQLGNYKRQYRGLILQHGRIIELNAFCDVPDTHGDDPFPWLRYWRPKVIDGGDCFFRADYDVQLQRFLDLSINAEV